MRTLQTEFPASFGAALPSIPADWRADHWGNDVCPSWVAWRSADEYRAVKVWIDHVDPDQREMDNDRFMVTVSDEYVDGGNVVEVCSSDDWAAILRAVERAIGR
jgi:hypothetical protein